MVNLLNDSILPGLPSRSAPLGAVACGTCHRGLPVPRTLQDTLRITYATTGYDAMVAEYRRLRERTYGDGTFDFGDVPLADVGAYLEQIGSAADAERAHALNVSENPQSAFAKRQHVGIALLNAYGSSESSGAARWDALTQRYPAAAFRADILLGVAEALNRGNRTVQAIAVLVRATTVHPQNAEILEALGDAYVKQADRTRARDAFIRALEISPSNERLRTKLNSVSS
jgi:tetratricopeptide (TPR) repeat protein